MASGSFEETSLGWKLSQWQQQIGEWFEWQFSKLRPDWKPPDWSEWPEMTWLSVLWRVLLWAIVVAIAVWFIWQVWPLVKRLYAQWMQPMTTPPTPKADPIFSAAVWLTRARAFQQQGNYRDACRALYMAALQRLHERNLLPSQASRTDGEYWQALQSDTHAQAYRVLLRTHEQLCFGQRDITAQAFERCQQAYLELERP